MKTNVSQTQPNYSVGGKVSVGKIRVEAAHGAISSDLGCFYFIFRSCLNH